MLRKRTSKENALTISEYIIATKRKINLSNAGSTISVLSSTCASCSSLGFLLVSTFGGVGVTVSTILSNYQIPLRLLSIVLLIWAYYSISSKLTKTCDIRRYNTGKL